MSKQVVTLRINGNECEAYIYHHRTLLEVLREKFGFTGAKEGCGMGACGACTVMVDGEAVLACLILAVSVEGKDIRTVEGLVEDTEISPLQKAYNEQGAIQCGYCTPGMLMSSTALLLKNPTPTGHEVKRAISGNLCRCTGYVKIVDAVLTASGNLRKGSN